MCLNSWCYYIINLRKYTIGVDKLATFRIQKNKENPYVMINKEFLEDEKLSAKAKGILAYLLSLPDDWQIYEEELVKHFKDGIDSLRTGIKELVNIGYIERVRIRDEKGMLRAYDYSVYEVPIHMGKSKVGESKIGKPKVGKSNATNIDFTNKNLTNNKHTKASNFNNFEQREYDYEELEKKLLGWDK